MSHQTKKVMISSTARDLPEHREQVMHACMRLGMFYPDMMEHLTATDANALEVSLKMVDRAEIYLGVFAFRYGYVPEDQTISVTEAEYNRVIERDIPRLIFLMGDEHPVKPIDVETGEGAKKLKELKDRLKKDRVVGFFNSADDLRAQVIQALVEYREPDLETFHYISDIPAPPEPFIAHPYTLLQTHRLVGRQPELNLLTDWVAKPDSEVYKAHILNIVAIGGLGKSALTWKWFNDIAPQEMTLLAGRMWWSFYESDATFENFVTRALAYVSRRPLDEVQKIPAPDRETQLLAALDREPYLIVLDGLERMLIAYARMDAAHLSDDDYDKQTANFVANVYGLPASAAQSFTGEHRLRKTADPRAGAFLRKLSGVRAARILVSTRLYPADLQTVTGEPRPACFAIFLTGLADDDALELWRAFGVAGARDVLLPLFHRVGNHPLLVQALAGVVARYHQDKPGDFDGWRRDHPDFDPFSLPLVQVKSHVLEFALRGLDDKAREALHVIAAFRMPARYDTLAALLISEGKACSDEHGLDKVLTELEDRGLIGWDKRANRYDLHPIVRGVVWNGLGDDTRRGIYTSLHEHFEALPMIDDWEKVSSLEDLTPAIELYNTLIGLGRYDDAYQLFDLRIVKANLYRLSASRQSVELLELLFPDGLDHLPHLSRPQDQAVALEALGQAFAYSGRPKRAMGFYKRKIAIFEEMEKIKGVIIGLSNLIHAELLIGSIREAEQAARRMLLIVRDQERKQSESPSLYWFGLIFGIRGKEYDSAIALSRSLRIAFRVSAYLAYDYSATCALWSQHFEDAMILANKALEYSTEISFERGIIRATRLQGATALGLNDYGKAEECLLHTIIRARAVNLVEDELPALVALAELRRRQGDLKAACELLDDVWDAAERGPYPLFHADACNVLAQIERDAGNEAGAVEAAVRAYRLAWCDGPPFAYHWGLERARKHLGELGAAEPEMPPFDESKYEPMPEVEIDPEDEFHAGKRADEQVVGSVGDEAGFNEEEG
jgi:tetratricopeptide (TPR) repeat protein